jgi:hypothetical protein
VGSAAAAAARAAEEGGSTLYLRHQGRKRRSRERERSSSRWTKKCDKTPAREKNKAAGRHDALGKIASADRKMTAARGKNWNKI